MLVFALALTLQRVRCRDWRNLLLLRVQIELHILLARADKAGLSRFRVPFLVMAYTWPIVSTIVTDTVKLWP